MDFLNIEKYIKVTKEFYLQSTEIIAKNLLGKVLVRKSADSFLAGMIVEVEAYLSENDFASHSSVGMTKRNNVMFEEGGKLYVYKIYGVHHCINVVTERAGIGSAVLIRAIEPLSGINQMMENRKCSDIRIICRGPGNVAKAFGIDLKHNGISLLSDDIFLLDFKKISKNEISNGRRIGITKSDDLLLRFFISESKFISGTKKQNI
jgi:DNA-3-methyladenine glycosylase